jgi:hypothetical protein
MRAIKALTVTTAAIASITVAVGVYWHVTRSPIEFERSVWLQGESTSDSPRFRMAGDLLRSEVLLGKSRAEIEIMLGPPTSTDKFRDSGLVYWLSPERGFISIDSEWLTLNFDQTGKVRDARIVTD